MKLHGTPQGVSLPLHPFISHFSTSARTAGLDNSLLLLAETRKFSSLFFFQRNSVLSLTGSSVSIQQGSSYHSRHYWEPSTWCLCFALLPALCVLFYLFWCEEKGSGSHNLTFQEILHILGHLSQTASCPDPCLRPDHEGCFHLSSLPELIEAEPHFLSREILWHLRQQQQEEFTVYEGSPPHTLATALGSTDLSLQISASDLPQPLRSDHP